MLFQIHIDLCKRFLCIYDSYNMYSIDGYMHVHEVITKKVNTFSQVVLKFKYYKSFACRSFIE